MSEAPEPPPPALPDVAGFTRRLRSVASLLTTDRMTALGRMRMNEMRHRTARAACWIVTALAAFAATSVTHWDGAQVVAPPEATAKTWIGRATEIEADLRTARIVRTERTERGVTQPARAFFEAGGPVTSMTWKALPPGRSRGFYESYKSEIAAYDIDKLLELDMVPPKVERDVDGVTGVAVMWVEPTKSFAALGGVPKPPPARLEKWNRELIRAKMFHNLIGDIDPNLGNWLVDPAWNVILIDQSRALTTTTKLVHQLQRIDQPLWERMRALSEDGLARALSQWLDRDQIRALLDRRTGMQEQIDRLVRAKGQTQVFVR